MTSSGEWHKNKHILRASETGQDELSTTNVQHQQSASDTKRLTFFQSPGPSPEGHHDAEAPKHLQVLLHEYTASNDNTATSSQIRLGHVQALCHALLQHYFPKDKGYATRPSKLGPLAKHGFNLMLKFDNGVSPDYASTKFAMKNPKRERARESKYTENLKDNWHQIDPEDITGFQVANKTADGCSEGSKYRPHTYLAVMIDDLTTFSSIADTNHVHRGDVLTDVLCWTQQIRAGFGILVYGTRLEVYDFENRQESEEPYVKLTQTTGGEDMVLDLQKTSMHDLDAMLKEVELRAVDYLD